MQVICVNMLKLIKRDQIYYNCTMIACRACSFITYSALIIAMHHNHQYFTVIGFAQCKLLEDQGILW